MKPIVTVGIFSKITSLVLWSAVASAQTPPATGGAKEVSDAAPSSDVSAPATAAPPASDVSAPTGDTAAPGDAAEPTTEQTASDDDDASADGNGKKDKKKKRKKKAKKAKAEAESIVEDEDTGSFVGDITAGDPWGATKGNVGIRGLNFRLLAQTQYRQSFGVSSNNTDSSYRLPEETIAKSGDGWGVSRLFFGVTAEPSKYLHLKLLTDFAEFKNNNSGKAVKQAFAELRPIPKHLHVSAGILKLPYSIQELDSISNYEFTVSGPTNELGNQMNFSGRDIGATVMVAPLDKERYLKLTLGAFRGHANKENASPVGTIAARAETEPFRGLRIGAGAGIQPKDVVNLNPLSTSGKDLLPNPSNPAYPRSSTWKKGYAVGADVTFQQKGLMLRGEGLMGSRVDYDTRYGADQWAAAWGIAAYKFDAGPIKLEPAVRVEFLDSDFGNEGGLYKLFALAIGTHFNSATKLILEVNRQIVDDNTPVIDQPRPLQEVPYNVLNATTFTGRLQIVL